MTKIDKFLGKWELVSDQSEYDLGTPPTAGTYEIIQDGDQLTFNMAWIDAEGQDHQMAYSEICDGQFHPYANTEIADEICLTLQSDTVLASVAKKNDAVVLSAKRVLESDSDLKVIMSGPLPNGRIYHNIAFYKKG